MTTSGELDTLFPHDVTGEISASVIDLDDTPNHVIGLAEDWQIKVRWSLNSHAPVTSPLTVIDGNWRVDAYAEGVGGGYSGQLPGSSPIPMSASIPALTAEDGRWRTTLTVPASTITAPGIYKVTVMLTFLDAANTPTDMVGFVECPMIAFHA